MTSEHSDPAHSGSLCDLPDLPIIMTGGAGFLGQLLIGVLRAAGHNQPITVVDRVPHPDDSIHSVLADLAAEPESLASLLTDGPVTLFHLASVVSAGAEADWSEAMRVNVAGLVDLVESCRASGHEHRVVFTSSVAVFGGSLAAEPTGDLTKQSPTSTYGMTKAFGELLIDDASRKGFIDGRTARLPTVIVRPGRPNLAASSFCSGIFREPLQGEVCSLPVSTETRVVVISPRTAVDGLLRLASIDADSLGGMRAVALPGLSVTVSQMLDALETAGGPAARALVRSDPDDGIAAIVGGWPGQWEDSRSRALGFAANSDLAEIIAEFTADHLMGGPGPEPTT